MNRFAALISREAQRITGHCCLVVQCEGVVDHPTTLAEQKRPEKTVLERLKLDGRIAVVTGGAAGLDQVSALALAEAGAKVAIIDRAARNNWYAMWLARPILGSSAVGDQEQRRHMRHDAVARRARVCELHFTEAIDVNTTPRIEPARPFEEPGGNEHG
jgi:hypothetical protein